MEYSSLAWKLGNVVFIINIILVIVVVFFERRSPSATLTWILVLVFIPLLGFLLYVFLGQNLRRKKLFYLKEEEEHKLLSLLAEQDANLRKNSLQFNDPRTRNYLDLVYLQMVSSYSLLTQDNQIKVFREGEALFNSILAGLKNAQYYIHMEYFIIRNDALGRQIMKILSEKAQEGVEVKLLYDGMGCIRLTPRFFKNLHEAGGRSAAFFPPFLPHINIRINYRNHRKIIIIDGDEAYVGGFNVGDEYLGLSPCYGYWRDCHLKIRGSAVNSLEIRFLMDWRFAAQDPLLNTDYYFSHRKPEGNSSIQIVSSGPDMKYPAIKNGYLKLINKAKRNVYIESPYLIPDESILESLKIAALSGVDVRIMIPYKPDHFYVYWASISYVGELLEAGVRCYLYKKGFMHSKVVCSDGFVSSVGTANLDIRSFELNFEVNAFIYDEEISRQLEESFLLALEDCSEITREEYAARPMSFRFREGLFRLLSPIL